MSTSPVHIKSSHVFLDLRCVRLAVLPVEKPTNKSDARSPQFSAIHQDIDNLRPSGDVFHTKHLFVNAGSSGIRHRTSISFVKDRRRRPLVNWRTSCQVSAETHAYTCRANVPLSEGDRTKICFQQYRVQNWQKNKTSIISLTRTGGNWCLATWGHPDA